MNREDLKSYRYSQEWVEEQISKYEEMRERVYKLSQLLDGMPKAQNKPNYTLEDLMDKFNELIEIVYKDQEKLNLIIKQLNKLKPLHKIILYKRYIKGKTVEEIAIEINYSYYETCRINGNALKEFDKLDKESKKTQDFAKNM